MHMIGYLGGDADIYASRRATEGDLRFTGHLVDHDRALSLVIGQDGAVGLSWATLQNAHDPDVAQVWYIGQINEPTEDGMAPSFKLFDVPIDTSRPIRPLP